ncbi:MAG: hypothetical protein QG638_158, partial [Pseudomonadota bacterium]|nr:hypothetical protein [Pseudomonadota bacterium]
IFQTLKELEAEAGAAAENEDGND